MNKIKSLRLANNLRQIDLAIKLNITREAVAQWESGKTFPKRKTLYKLARILKCKPADLL
ncbi:helix-turn-helix transcriptional regulator [Megamonas funiformis]|uniref:HTH cro/C1-type domain-containing protein n=1 Tax=Megamonas funiformis YIT 11815 TaxID=742816 RepID=A0ABN0EJR5_9FIRM|nr:helix-turn-helix transcriptional regulator [Megamonas funiformis]EHR38477.1 hypothetical protein HMPREF9454_00782 [Megamonas funiformis YIT 11815]QIB59896.1 helix-turn-helix transcriptional regulator [Megamonas funiformis]DAZ61578.1 MAG TPA: helix-turn-helix domain protein [Caudoviricetes sp.]